MICSQCKREFPTLSAYDGHICGVALAKFDEEDDTPARTDFGVNEGESWDSPEKTHNAIAEMAAGRAGARIKAAGLAPAPIRRQEFVCGLCNTAFIDQRDLETHHCPMLGKSHEDAERDRVASLSPPAPVPRREIASRGDDVSTKIAVREVMREVFREMAIEIQGIRHDIRANTDVLKMADVPLEAVADAHERASSSFENLRHDMLDMSQRFGEVEGVMDTAGLKEAAGRAEARFEALAQAIKQQLTENSQNMVRVLNLLSKLHARELDRDNERAARLKRKKR
jgi:hypothetical protein